MLRMDTLPKAGPDGYEAGGDNIWASGYGIYECKLAYRGHGLVLER
jgi:hypothetical protein